VRLGCGGCLGSLLLLLFLAGAALSGVWIASRATAVPEQAPVIGTERDGIRAQQTLFEIVRRGASRRPPAERTRVEYALTEAELNALLARHLGRVSGLPLSDLAVRLVGGGIVELLGRVDADQIAGESSVAGYLPEGWRRAGFLVTLRGPLRLETETSRGQARALRFEIDEAYVGRQRVPVFAIERVLAAGERLGRWSVPDSVSAVIIEKGRAVVQIDS
jgi:hypothetical protein